MKLSGRLLILILIAVLIQGRAPLVTGARAQGNADPSTVTLEGEYTGWIEIDVRHSWDSPATDVGLVENYFSFNYVRSRGSLRIDFVSGKPQEVNIVLPLVFYFISRQHMVYPAGIAGDPCQGYHIFTTGTGRARYTGPANGNTMTFDISGFKFKAQPNKPSVIGTGGNCEPGIEPARNATRQAAKEESALPGDFPWRFETTRWTEPQFTNIGGSCSSADYELLLGAAIQCFWGAVKVGAPTSLLEPPYRR